MYKNRFKKKKMIKIENKFLMIMIRSNYFMELYRKKKLYNR